MPFPLAHPAAVLPLRRYCPRVFSFPALVIGSLVPDLGYFFGRKDLPEFSHSLLGSVLFCLPVGILTYMLLYQLRSVMLRKHCPARLAVLTQLAWPSFGSAASVACALLVGAWTHMVLDAFTHKGGWVSQQLPVLGNSLGSFAGHAVRVYGLLWFVFSFIGIAVVFLAFRSWQEKAFATATTKSARADWQSALLVASAVVPIELLHRLLNNWIGMLLVSVSTLLLLAVVARRLWSRKATSVR